MSWVALYAAGAFACDWNSYLDGFDDWLVDGVEIPTDARIVIQASGGPLTVELTRLDTGELVETDEADEADGLSSDDVWRVVYEPRAHLDAYTSYRVDVVAPNIGQSVTTTFTTGGGPTDPDVEAPTIVGLEAGAWYETSGPCEPFLMSRALPIEVRLPPALPPGSYIGVGSDRARNLDYVRPLDGSSLWTDTFHQGFIETVPPLSQDCLAPVIVLPSGDEVVGDTVCAEWRGAGCHCTVSGRSVSSGWMLLLLALWVRRSGRRGSAWLE